MWLAGAPALCGQAPGPRTQAYVFAAGIDDVRALWINPAGLAVRTEASVHAEFVLDRPASGRLDVGQWAVGFNSRGFSAGYERDLHPALGAVDAIRVGVAGGFSRGAAGGALTYYRSDGDAERGLDLGVRYRLLPRGDLAGVVRHIGRPRVRATQLPLVGVAGVAWDAVPAHVQVGGEAHITERPLADTTSVGLSYRVGVRVATRGRLPLGLVSAFNLGSNFRIDRWTLGIAVGAADQLIATATAVPLVGGSQHVEALSVTGVASRRPPGRQF